MQSETISSPITSTLLMDSSNHGLPVTIITGFLGSGKTTLLNHILNNQEGIRTAVLVNEFGEIGIDHELIVTTEDNMVELSNGCICCTINDDLANAVYGVLERSDPIDYLVVETTGLADPLPVALTFLGSELRDLTRLDSIITVVDSENYSLDLFNSQVAYNQIAYGDIILLNKIDLVSESELVRLETSIRNIKPGVSILRTVKGQAPLPLLLSVGLFDSSQFFQPQSTVENPEHHHLSDTESTHQPIHDELEDHTNCVHDHGHCLQDHEHEHHSHHHDPNHLINDGFTSLSFQSDRPFNIKKFQSFLDDQLPPEVFRAKGILWFDVSPKRHIFHLSGKRFSLNDETWKGEPKNQLVMIGQNLDQSHLLLLLEQCLIDSNSL